MVKIDYTEDAEEDQTAVAAKAPKPKEPVRLGTLARCYSWRPERVVHCTCLALFF